MLLSNESKIVARSVLIELLRETKRSASIFTRGVKEYLAM